MSEHNTCCACLTVEYDPIDCGGGVMRERWKCKDCGTEYKKKFWLDKLKQENEALQESCKVSENGSSVSMARLQDVIKALTLAEKALEKVRDFNWSFDPRDQFNGAYRHEVKMLSKNAKQTLKFIDDLKEK